MNIVGLLLAAGSASRFGSDKLRHPLPHGVPIALQSLRTLRAELGDVLAVVKPGDDGLFASEGGKVVVDPPAAGREAPHADNMPAPIRSPRTAEGRGFASRSGALWSLRMDACVPGAW